MTVCSVPSSPSLLDQIKIYLTVNGNPEVKKTSEALNIAAETLLNRVHKFGRLCLMKLSFSSDGLTLVGQQVVPCHGAFIRSKLLNTCLTSLFGLTITSLGATMVRSPGFGRMVLYVERSAPTTDDLTLGYCKGPEYFAGICHLSIPVEQAPLRLTNAFHPPRPLRALDRAAWKRVIADLRIDPFLQGDVAISCAPAEKRTSGSREIVNFRVAKTVLAAHSPVFNELFRDSSSTSSTPIEMDAYPAIFETFIRFLQKGRTVAPSAVTHKVELLRLADRYEVEELMCFCINDIAHTFIPKTLSAEPLIMSEEEFLDLLHFALLHQRTLSGITLLHTLLFLVWTVSLRSPRERIFPYQEYLKKLARSVDPFLVNSFDILLDTSTRLDQRKATEFLKQLLETIPPFKAAVALEVERKERARKEAQEAECEAFSAALESE